MNKQLLFISLMTTLSLSAHGASLKDAMISNTWQCEASTKNASRHVQYMRQTNFKADGTMAGKGRVTLKFLDLKGDPVAYDYDFSGTWRAKSNALMTAIGETKMRSVSSTVNDKRVSPERVLPIPGIPQQSTLVELKADKLKFDQYGTEVVCTVVK